MATSELYYYIDLLERWYKLLVALWRVGQHELCRKVATMMNTGLQGCRTPYD